MARVRFRAGTYQVVTTTAVEVPIRVDNERFNIPPSSSFEFNSNNYWSYDAGTYTGLKVYRTPSSPVTITQSVGGESRLNPAGNTNTKTVRRAK